MTSPSRDAHLDNAKGLLILLVVYGHLLWPLPGEPVNQSAYALVYLFHMPCFALISGWLSRPWQGREGLARLARGLLAPYLLGEVLVTLILLALGEKIWPLQGTYGLWYLLALFWWRLSLPLFQRLSPGRAFLLGLLLALAAGYVPWPGAYLAAMRSFGLLPFFVAGNSLRRVGRRLDGLAPPGLAVSVLAAGAAVAWLAFGRGKGYVLLWSAYPYDFLGLTPLTGPLAMGLRILGGLALCAAVLAFVPGRKTLLSVPGERSLAVYLLHALLLPVYRHFSFLHEPLQSPPVALMLATSALAVWLLSREACGWWVRFVMSSGRKEQ